MRDEHGPAQRIRVEQGIYQQPNGKYAVCFMVEGRPRFRTVGYDLDAARIERAACGNCRGCSGRNADFCLMLTPSVQTKIRAAGAVREARVVRGAVG
jgi:hypothetical protein